MALYTDEGVVLRTAKLGEADRIITLFTRMHGKVRAVAKGVRRTKSRFGGRRPTASSPCSPACMARYAPWPKASGGPNRGSAGVWNRSCA